MVKIEWGSSQNRLRHIAADDWVCNPDTGNLEIFKGGRMVAEIARGEWQIIELDEEIN